MSSEEAIGAGPVQKMNWWSSLAGETLSVCGAMASTARSLEASEVLAERWSIIILRNIVILGCRTFNEIAGGVPGLSRGLLSKRLRELERAGVLEIRPKPDGPGSTYRPTEAGRELSEVMGALQRWGSKWAELTPNRHTPGWCSGCGPRSSWTASVCHSSGSWCASTIPPCRGPAVAVGCSSNWATPRSAKYPGGEEHLVVVVNDPVAFARWHLGEIEWGHALRTRAIELRGSRTLARALPTWHRDHERGPQPLHPVEPASDYTNQVAVAAPA